MVDQNKKDNILRCVKLGMDFIQSALVAECTDEELSELEEDDKFLRKISAYHAAEEMRLLEIHDRTAEKAAREGNSTSAIQWKLERLNPSRWGNRDSNRGAASVGSVTVNLLGVHPDGEKH